MLDYQMFVEAVVSRIKETLGEDCDVRVHGITRNNLSGEQALTILEQGSNVSPAITLGPYYQKYLKGTSLEEIGRQIRSEYQAGRFDGLVNMEFLREWQGVKDQIICRVIGAEHNRQMLEHVPCSLFLDMAVVYYYQFAMEGELQASMLIRSEYLDMWGISEEELKEQAVRNTRRLMPARFFDMKELLGDLAGVREETAAEEETIYVLTNSKKTFGAYWITEQPELEKVRRRLGEDFLILPSSIHEVIILPMHMEPDILTMAHMVGYINRTEVAKEEVLTDSVYSYREGKGIRLESPPGPENTRKQGFLVCPEPEPAGIL